MLGYLGSWPVSGSVSSFLLMVSSGSSLCCGPAQLHGELTRSSWLLLHSGSAPTIVSI